jgi:hypothetical protein
MTALKLFPILFLLAASLQAGQHRLWKASLAIVAATNAADTATSLRCSSVPGVRETNSLYGDRFGARGVSIKAALVVGNVLVQTLAMRKHPGMAWLFTALNGAQSAAPAWAGVHNPEVCK